MTAPPRPAPRALLLAVSVLLVLTGCSVTVGRSTMGRTTMGGGMHGGSVARVARCTGPARTTGTTVRVALMDMGRRGAGSRGSTMRGHMMRGHMMRGHTMRGHTMRGQMMLSAVPRVVAAGAVTFVAVNRGTRSHELVVLPLGHRTTAGLRRAGSGRQVDETPSLGEASRSCAAGEGHGIRPGAAGWTTVQLTPGRYELVCNRPGHYARGMYAELVVR